MDKIYVAGYCFDRKYETSLIYYAGFCHPSVLRIFFMKTEAKHKRFACCHRYFLVNKK